MCYQCTLCNYDKCYNRAYQYDQIRSSEILFYEKYDKLCESEVHPNIGNIVKCNKCFKIYCFLHWIKYKRKYGIKNMSTKTLNKCDNCKDPQLSSES